MAIIQSLYRSYDGVTVAVSRHRSTVATPRSYAEVVKLL